MRNGFHEENDAVTVARPHRATFREDKETTLPVAGQVTSVAESTTNEAAVDALIWQEVRKEVLFQNLFGPRQYCRWMSLVTIGLVLYKAVSNLVTMFPNNYNPNYRIPEGLVDLTNLVIMLPLILWGIAFIFFYIGGVTPILPNARVAGGIKGGKTVALTEDELKAATVRGRDKSRSAADRGTLFLWLGMLLTFVIPVILNWFQRGM